MLPLILVPLAVLAVTSPAHARGADGVDTTAAAAADRGYRDGLSANASSDHEGGQYGRKGATRSAYDKGWAGGTYRNGWLDALKDFFARGPK